MGSIPSRENRKRRKLCFKIAAIYAVLGALWIFFSDKMAAMLSSTPEVLTQIQIIKGWLYVLLTALLLYNLVSRGIKKLELSQEALCLSEEKYRELVQSARSIILQIDQQGRLTFFNEFAQSFFGYTSDEIIGRHMLGTIVPERDSSGRDLRQLIQDLLDHPERYASNQNENVRRNGERVWIAWTNKAIVDESGGIAEILCVGNDITELMRAEGALRESEERFRLAFENANIGMCLVSLDGRLTRVNHQMSEIFGYSRDELEGMTVNDLAHPEDLNISPTFIRRATLGEVEHVNFEKRYSHKQGHIVWGQISSSLVRDVSGAPQYFISHVQDITEHKQAEEEKDRLLNLSHDLICIAGTDGYFKYLNPAWERTLGYPREHLLSKPFLDFIYPEDHQQNDEEVAKLASNQLTLDFQNRYVHSDGSIRTIDWRATPLPEKGLFYCIGRDITERKRAEKAVLRANEDWERTFDAVPDLIAILDNDYRIVRANRAMAAKLGVTPEECAGLTCYHAVHGTSEPPSFCPHSQLLVDRIEHTTEVHEDRLGGDFALSVSPLFDPAGKLIGSVYVARDITERKQAEEALRESEERYRRISDMIADYANSCIKPAGEEFAIDWVAGAVEKITGYSSEEVLNHRCWKFLVHPLDVPIFEKNVIGLSPGDASNCELRIVRKDGSIRWIRVLSRAAEDSRNPLSHRLFGSCEDITERKEVEEVLIESRNFLTRIINAIADPVFVKDRQHRWILLNDSLCSFMGHSREELTGKSDYDYFPAREADVFWQKDEEVFASGIENENEEELTDAKGTTHTIITKKSRYGDASGEQFLVGVIRDVTERKRAEDALRESVAKYRAVIENMEDVFYRTDREGNLVLLSPSGARLFGLDSAEPIYGRNVAMDFYAIAEERDRLLQALKTDGAVRDYDVTLKRPDGSLMFVSTNSHIYRDANGEPLGVEGVFRDITERKRTEEALRESQERLHLALESARAGTWDRDIVADKSTWDDFLHQLFGLAPGTFSGKLADFLVRLHPDDRERIRSGMISAFSGADDYAASYRVVWPDSSVHFIASRGKVYRDSAGRALRMIGVGWDVTELHLAEEALWQSEERLRLSLEATNDGVWDWNVPTGNTIFSPRWYTMLGYEPYEFPQNYDSWRSLVHPDDVDRAERQINQHIASGEGFAIEMRMRIKSGGWRWILTRGSVVERDADGRPVRMVGTHSDITERKRAEEALREAERKYRNIFENAREGIYQSTPEGRYLTANPAMARIYGYSSPEEMIAGIDSIDREIYVIPEKREELKRLLATKGEVKDFEVQQRRKDGSTFWVSLNVHVVCAEDGRILHWEGRSVDITERVRAKALLLESEKRFRMLTENLPLGVSVMREDLTYEYFNPRFTEIFGYTLEDLPNRQSLFEKLYPEVSYREEILSQWRRADIEHPEPGRVREAAVTTRCKTGQDKRIHIRSVVLEDRSHLVSYEDVTEHRKLEDQLRQAQKVEAIGTLAGGIAHDLNNILGIIVGYTELAKLDHPEKSTTARRIEEALKACNRAKNLVRQILTFSRMEDEQERQPVDISRVIRETLSFLRATLPTTVEIRQDILGREIMISADPTQIHQVLTNLATNAAHAMEEFGGVLEVTLTEVNFDPDNGLPHPSIKPGPYVRLTVSDTGHGMDSRTLERIFDPYFTTKEVGKGSGLGLAVVHGIITRHEGAMTVHSEVGKGTTFHVYLPRIHSKATIENERHKALPKGTERILFVDDEAALVDIGKERLQFLGYEVLAKTSSVEALDVFRAQPERFDLVITDYTMPQMTGVDLAKEIMRIRPDIPVILCTGFSERISKDEAKGIGIRAFSMKPISMRDIAETIRRVLDRE